MFDLLECLVVQIVSDFEPEVQKRKQEKMAEQSGLYPSGEYMGQG